MVTTRQRVKGPCCVTNSMLTREVIEVAITRSFGLMPFHPGPGLDGQRIAIDPSHLTRKTPPAGLELRLIELAQRISSARPTRFVDCVIRGLNRCFNNKGIPRAAY